MSKNSQSPKTEESKVDPVVQAVLDEGDTALAMLADAAKSNEVTDNTPPATPTDSEEEGDEKFVEVRVLTICQLGVANDVAEVPKGSLRGLKSLGYVDDHPDAVAFAKALKVPKA